MLYESQCRYPSDLNTDTLKPINARHVNYSDFHKNRVIYNNNTNNEATAKNVII